MVNTVHGIIRDMGKNTTYFGSGMNITSMEKVANGAWKTVICEENQRCMVAVLVAKTDRQGKERPSQTSALTWISWKEIKAMMEKGVAAFRKLGSFVRPGRHLAWDLSSGQGGNIYGGRFLCKAAIEDSHGTDCLNCC